MNKGYAIQSENGVLFSRTFGGTEQDAWYFLNENSGLGGYGSETACREAGYTAVPVVLLTATDYAALAELTKRAAPAVPNTCGTFLYAIEQLQKGLCVRRREWGKWDYLEVRHGVFMYMFKGCRESRGIQMDDIIATDWIACPAWAAKEEA